MFGAISRRLATGSALLLTAFLAAVAAEIDDDLRDLTDQVAQMASEVALELQQVCPPASPSDQAAFDRCRHSLFCDSALRRNLASRLLWGRRNQDAGAALKNTNLTQFAPDVITGLYLSLFMYSGEYSTEYVARERLYLIRLRAGFRNLLPPRAVSLSVLARRGEVGCVSGHEFGSALGQSKDREDRHRAVY